MKILHLIFVTVGSLFFTSAIIALTFDTGGRGSRGGSYGGYSGQTINEYNNATDRAPLSGPSREYGAFQQRMIQSRAISGAEHFNNSDRNNFDRADPSNLGEPPCPREERRVHTGSCTPGNGCNSIKYPW